MRTTVLAALAFGTLVGAGAMTIAPAGAADLGDGRAVRPPRDFAPPYETLNIERWTGFYLGGTLGYGFGNTNTGGDIGTYTLDQSGALGTLFAGYNWQLGRTVLGVEADIGAGGLGSRTPTAFGMLETDLNMMGSVRGRAGFLATPALLLYATGGLAWANMDIAFGGAAHNSATFFGYQLGAGGEMMMSDRVGLRLEYLYTDLSRETLTHSGLSNAYSPDFHTVRAGLSFKF